jgi:hypothetical protein
VYSIKVFAALGIMWVLPGNYTIFTNGVDLLAALQDEPQRLKPVDSTAVTAWLKPCPDGLHEE